jgi:hypothetical protein
VSSASTGAANEWFEIGLGPQGRVYIERNAAGSKRTVIGSQFLENSTRYTLLVSFDGIDYYAQIGSLEQNPLIIDNFAAPFEWFGDVAGAANIVIGGTVTSGGLVRPFQGEILELTLYPEDIVT